MSNYDLKDTIRKYMKLSYDIKREVQKSESQKSYRSFIKNKKRNGGKKK